MARWMLSLLMSFNCVEILYSNYLSLIVVYTTRHSKEISDFHHIVWQS